MNMKVIEAQIAASKQFVEDYTLVVDNYRESYYDIIDSAEYKAKNVSALSDRLRADFEEYIGQVAEREREEGYEVGAMLISQLLLNWGASTFDKIARHYLEMGE